MAMKAGYGVSSANVAGGDFFSEIVDYLDGGKKIVGGIGDIVGGISGIAGPLWEKSTRESYNGTGDNSTYKGPANNANTATVAGGSSTNLLLIGAGVLVLILLLK